MLQKIEWLLTQFSNKAQSMKNFIIILFSRFYILLKDDFSAMAVLAYFFSLNCFTVIGYCQHLFFHAGLSKVPVFYSLIVMLLAGIFTYQVIFRGIKQQYYLQKNKEFPLATAKAGSWLTILYVFTSFTLMLTAL